MNSSKPVRFDIFNGAILEGSTLSAKHAASRQAAGLRVVSVYAAPKGETTRGNANGPDEFNRNSNGRFSGGKK
jgi:hypothetical protein